MCADRYDINDHTGGTSDTGFIDRDGSIVACAVRTATIRRVDTTARDAPPGADAEEIALVSAINAKSCRRAITGTSADLTGNRVKRIFEDPVGLSAGRVGLSGAEDLRRAPHTEFRRRGISLAKPDGPRPMRMVAYARDTGSALVDIAAAIYVRGEHWGGLRAAYDPVALA